MVLIRNRRSIPSRLQVSLGVPPPDGAPFGEAEVQIEPDPTFHPSFQPIIIYGGQTLVVHISARMTDLRFDRTVRVSAWEGNLRVSGLELPMGRVVQLGPRAGSDHGLEPNRQGGGKA